MDRVRALPDGTGSREPSPTVSAVPASIPSAEQIVGLAPEGWFYSADYARVFGLHARTLVALMKESGDFESRLNENESSLLWRRKPLGLVCHDCGAPYGGEQWIEAVVPDAIWNDYLSPTHNEAGILCIGCMAKRAVLKGLRSIPVKLTAGPFVLSASPIEVPESQSERTGA